VADGKLVIVTGASENHARPLLNLLKSTAYYEPGTKIVVYDLGLEKATLGALRRRRCNVVPFRFADYPPHVGADRLRTYAWKPAMVHEVLQGEGLPLLYLDAGDLVHKRLDRVRAELARTGFYSPSVTGTIVEWCHPATLEAMQVEAEIRNDGNRNAAIVGFGTTAMAREIGARWYECAMQPDIICPPGATKKDGHRFDQTVLSILVARARRQYGFTPEDELLDISYHNDKLTPQEARGYMKSGPVSGGTAAVLLELEKRRPYPVRCLRRAAKTAWEGIKAMATRD
jgi:hypothetical protein